MLSQSAVAHATNAHPLTGVTLRYRRCLEYPDSALFHPLMFVDGVIDAFVRRGGRVHERTRVVTQTIMDGRQVSIQCMQQESLWTGFEHSWGLPAG